MTTLQTGTKVLIEATVEATKDNDVHAVTKSAYVIRVDKSDLTVCETAQPIDLKNFAIDITDPVNAELLSGFKQWFMKDYKTKTSFNYQYYEVLNGSKNRTNHYDTPHYLTTLPELQKQHPGVFEPQQIEVGDWVQPNFNTQNLKSDTHYSVQSVNDQWFTIRDREGKEQPFSLQSIGKDFIKVIVPEPTPSFKAGQEVLHDGDEVNVRFAFNEHWTKEPWKFRGVNAEGEFIVERIHKTIPEAKIGEISTAAEIKRPIPAQPTVEQEILAELEAFAHSVIENPKHSSSDHLQGIMEIFDRHQKHSGRVEVSVPSDDKIEYRYEYYSERNGGNVLDAVIKTVRHFMTRKEAGK